MKNTFRNTRLVNKIAPFAKAKGFSLLGLSERIKCRPSTLSQIASGKSQMSPDILVRVCDELGCQPGDILTVVPKEEKID